jgi:hypothetical protein
MFGNVRQTMQVEQRVHGSQRAFVLQVRRGTSAQAKPNLHQRPLVRRDSVLHQLRVLQRLDVLFEHPRLHERRSDGSVHGILDVHLLGVLQRLALLHRARLYLRRRIRDLLRSNHAVQLIYDVNDLRGRHCLHLV